MATETIDQLLAGMPGDQEIWLLTDPKEIESLNAWRAADDQGKRDVEKLLRAGSAGLLPSIEEFDAMTQAESRAFIDSLPESLA